MATGTLKSPRIENGIIKWYEGDAFYLRFPLTYKSGEEKRPYILEENDSVSFEITDCRDRTIVQIESLPQDAYGVCLAHIDKETTKRLTEGIYHYKLRLHINNSEVIQTITNCGDIEVSGGCSCQT